MLQEIHSLHMALDCLAEETQPVYERVCVRQPYLDAFGVLLIKGADVESICGIHLSPRRD